MLYPARDAYGNNLCVWDYELEEHCFKEILETGFCFHRDDHNNLMMVYSTQEQGEF